MDQNQYPQQNQAPQPDYGFILNQNPTGSPGPTSPQPKKRNVKVIIIIILLVLLAGAVLFAVLLPDSQPSTTQNDTSTSSEQTDYTPATFDEAVQSAQQYFAYITTNQADQAYDMQTPELQATIPRDQFNTMIVQTYVSSIDFSQCKAEPLPAAQANEGTISYTCPASQAPYQAIFRIHVVQTDEGLRVNSYTIEARKTS